MSDEVLPYGRQHIDEDDVAAVTAVLRSDWLTTGPAVEEFERQLSDVSGGHPVVAMNSGTAALHAAYAAAGVGPGTNIVTSPLTFASTATAALHLGAEVRFADVNPSTLLMDPHCVAAVVDSSTRVITAVDYAGQPVPNEALQTIADDAGAWLVADAAHSIGAHYQGRPVGDLADLTTFSFHPVKTITTGEGGAVVVRDTRLLEAVKRFRNHGLVRSPELLRSRNEGPWHQEVQSLGLNYRMPDILAALGTSQLRKIASFVARRSHLVSRYRHHLEDVDGLRLVETPEGAEPAWHIFPVRILKGRRAEVYGALRSHGIQTQVHYLPAHLHPLMVDRGHTPGSCPEAVAAYGELLTLPLYPDLTESQQDRVIREVRRTLQG